MKELTKSDLNKMSHRLTVGDIKKFIEKHNLPDNAIVVTERIEDTYFDNHGWGVYLKDSEIGEPKNQYYSLWCCVKYHDEDDILFLDGHY